MSGLESIWTGLKNWAGKVAERVDDAFNGASRGGNFGSGRSGGFGTASRAVSYASSIPASSPAASLPRLANGAVIPPNQQFAAILGDQRSGMNLEAPAGLIRQMVAEGMQAVLASGGFGRGGDMTVIMEIDGREFGRASYKYGTAERQRVGVRLTEVRT